MNNEINLARKIFITIKMIVKILIKIKKRKIKNLLYWFKSFWFKGSQSNSLSDEKPWLVINAISFLEKYVSSGINLVYEFGSGGSTLFFASKAKKVISIEHNAEWYSKVKCKLLENNFVNVKLNLIEPELYSSNNIPFYYFSSSPGYYKMSFKKYVDSILSYNDNFFDIILIDGRSRPGCLANSFNKVKVNGLIVFDNSERDSYQNDLTNLPKNFEVMHKFKGPSPYCEDFNCTTIIRRKY